MLLLTKPGFKGTTVSVSTYAKLQRLKKEWKVRSVSAVIFSLVQMCEELESK